MRIKCLDQLDTNGCYSYADYLQWEFEERVELIEGKLYPIPPTPGTKHQQYVGEIFRQISNHVHRSSCKVFVAPDLIVEVLSPGNTDREMNEKFEIYQENGVKEYWLVEPNDRTLLVYLLDEMGRYIGLKPFTESETLTSRSLRSFELLVRDILMFD